MFSGKTTHLLNAIEEQKTEGKKVFVFKPKMDDRYAEESIVSHDKNETEAFSVAKSVEILDYYLHADVIAIDEVQFFDDQIVDVCQKIANSGKKILGIKLYHKGRGGLEHRYFVEKIKEHYIDNDGFTYLEKGDIDLVVESVQMKIAIQVETGKSDIQCNLTKLGRYKADQKYVLTTNKETEIKITETLKDLLIPDKERIQILYVKDFLKNPPSI